MAASDSVIKRIASLYVEGFKNMTVGRSLWAIILLKLVIFFAVLKLFFFPNLLSRDYDTDEQRASAVRSALIQNDNKPINHNIE